MIANETCELLISIPNVIFFTFTKMLMMLKLIAVRCLCDDGYYFFNGNCLTEEECGCIIVRDGIIVKYEVDLLYLFSTFSTDLCKILPISPK